MVQAVAFSEAGVDIQWMLLPDDVRSHSHVVSSRQTSISFQAPAGLGAAATDLQTAVEDLARMLLDNWDELPVYEPPAAEQVDYTPRPVDDDDDEDIGMGDGR